MLRFAVPIDKAIHERESAALQAVILKAKKMAKQSPAFKTEMADFEEKLLTTAAERKEEEATAQVT